MANVLVLTECPVIRQYSEKLIDKTSCGCAVVANASEAWEQLYVFQDIILVDVRTSPAVRMDFIQDVLSTTPELPVIAIVEPSADMEQVTLAGVTACVTKQSLGIGLPAIINELVSSLRGESTTAR